MAVIADSPLFSTLVARNAPAEIKGTALTIVNCIGFAITIVSIQLVSGWVEEIGPSFIYTTLAVGPVFGLIALRETPSHAT
jgi:MFS family permease